MMNFGNCLSRKTISEIQLVLCCFFFGFTYVGQKQANNRNIDVYSFTAGRFLVSTLFLFSIRAPLKDAIESDISDEKKEELDQLAMNKLITKLRLMLPFTVSEKQFHLYFWALIYGIVNFIASELLQLGMIGATAGKSAFIIGLNVVVIQIIEVALPDYNSSLSWVICGAISLSVLGLYFLSGCFELLYYSSGESCADAITSYDVLVFLSMICFGICILLADAGSSRTDCIDLMCLSFLITTILCIGMAVIYDGETWLDVSSMYSIFSYNTCIIAYTGIAEVSAVTLGTLGQMYISPTRSALIMSLEATSSAFLAYIFIHEVLSVFELVGCCLMFSATVLSTTASVEDESDSDVLPLNVTSVDSLSQCEDSDSTGFDFAETSDFLERFLVTNQRSLRRSIVLRRSRSTSCSRSPTHHPSSERKISHSLDENTHLLSGHNRTGFVTPEGNLKSTPAYNSIS